MRKRELQAELGTLRAEMAALGTPLELAKQMVARITDKAANLSQTALQAALAETAAAMEEQQLQQAIWARIGELPAQTVLSWYREAVGGEQVDELMRRRAEQELAARTESERIEQMKVFGKKRKAADLSMALAHDLIEFSFGNGYDVTTRKIPDDSGKNLFDLVNASHSAIRATGPHQILELGSVELPGKPSQLDPVINIGSPLSYRLFGTEVVSASQLSLITISVNGTRIASY